MKLRAILVLFAALVLMPAAAAAQDPGRDRIERELDLTDLRIEQAQTLLSGADSDRARAEVDLAVALQGQARGAFNGSQYAFAGRLTLEARGHADRAIAIMKGPDPEGVQAQLERTRDMLERARERVEECNQTRARSMIRVAFEMQSRAERAARDGRYLAALQLTVNARERGLQALRLCNLEENRQEGAERALRRTDEGIQRAMESVGPDAPEVARRSLERARDMQERAWREYRAERWEASLRLTQSARAFAHRALRLAGARR